MRGACHTDEGLGLIKTTREGLCARNATKTFPDPAIGSTAPLAINDCEVCHHYHRSEFKGVLVADAQTLCYFCHDRVDLEVGAHHETIDARPVHRLPRRTWRQGAVLPDRKGRKNAAITIRTPNRTGHAQQAG